jgi:hypothetical protein
MFGSVESFFRLYRPPIMFDNQPKRHPCNTKLKLFYGQEYRGHAVQQKLQQGPLIENYLERGLQVLQRCQARQARTLVVRIDLRFPYSYLPEDVSYSNDVMRRFFYHLNAELTKAHTKYPPTLRYLWCRERNHSQAPHYHLMLLLNYDAFAALGDYRPNLDGRYDKENLFHRIARSWGYALELAPEAMSGLVHACQNPRTGWPFMRMDRSNPYSLHPVVYAMSYLCKAWTKALELGQHFAVFTTSRT